MHNNMGIPRSCKYSMLFDGIEETAFGRICSMKPRGFEGGLRFHLAHVTAISGHNARMAHACQACACYPKHLPGTARAVQFLTHGAGSGYVY